MRRGQNHNKRIVKDMDKMRLVPLANCGILTYMVCDKLCRFIYCDNPEIFCGGRKDYAFGNRSQWELEGRSPD